MRSFYAVCTVLGTILPCSQFIPWLADRGLDFRALLRAIASDRVSAFAWLDVLVSAVASLAFIQAEGRRICVRALWLPAAGTLTVGVSCGLPLFLFLRERHLTKKE